MAHCDDAKDCGDWKLGQHALLAYTAAASWKLLPSALGCTKHPCCPRQSALPTAKAESKNLMGRIGPQSSAQDLAMVALLQIKTLYWSKNKH